MAWLGISGYVCYFPLYICICKHMYLHKRICTKFEWWKDWWLRVFVLYQVVSYDFKENRFANLHRVAIGFPSSRFFYKGTPSSPSSAEAALKGETNVQMLFQEDPYGCIGPLHLKRVALETLSFAPFLIHMDAQS